MKKSQSRIMKNTTTITAILMLTATLLLPLLLTPTVTMFPAAAPAATKNTPVVGQGANTSATLIITGNTTSPGQADTENGFNIPCPQGWGILNTTLTITNITVPSAVYKTGERPGETGYKKVGPNEYAAMSFRILTDTATLYNVSLLIKRGEAVTVGPTTPSKIIYLYIMNATSEGVPKPNQVIASSSADYSELGGEVWLNFTFPQPVTLNSANTYNRLFFVVIYSSSADVTWKYVNDSPGNDDGYAYEGSPQSWRSMSVDFRMAVVLSPWPVYPSEVDLKVGRDDVGYFSVADVPGQRGNGTCIISGKIAPTQEAFVRFNATSNWTGKVSFNVSLANSTLYKDIEAGTTYAATPGQHVKWNVTVNAAGYHGFPEAGARKFINVSVPVDWWNSTPAALNKDTGETREYLVNAPGTLLFEATNGTWVMQCEGPNVLSSVTIYSLYEGFSPVNVSRAVVGDNLTVRGKLSATLSGTAKLVVLNASGVVFTNQAEFGGDVAELAWLNVSVDPGNYTLRLLVECGLKVGLAENPFTILAEAPCSITATVVERVGRVEIMVRVSRNDTGFPVVGASVEIYYANGTRIEAAITDNRNGTYLVSFKPPSEGPYNLAIKVSGNRIATASENVSFYYYEYALPPTPDHSLGLMLVTLQFLQVVQSLRMFSVLGAASVAAIAGGISGSRAYRRLRVPARALSSIENILVSHKETGLPLWGFDILALNVDESLVSGFVSAMRSFAEEMKIGGFSTLETRLGTFIRIEGELVEAICITGAASRLEVEWIRNRLRQLVKLVEAEAGPALGKWRGGDKEEFEEIFDHAFNTLFDYQKIARIQQTKILKLVKERERLTKTLDAIGEAPELSHEKELIQQRLAVINSTLARTKIRELTKISDTKTREELQKTRKELKTLKKELDEFKQTKLTKKKTNTK